MLSVDRIRIMAKTGKLVVKPIEHNTVYFPVDSSIWDCSCSSITVLLGGDNKWVAPIPHNIEDKRKYTIIVIQDKTGGVDVAFSSHYRFPNGVSSLPNMAPGSITKYQFYSTKVNGIILLDSISIKR